MQCKYSTTNARGIVSNKVVSSLQGKKKKLHKKIILIPEVAIVKPKFKICKNHVSFVIMDSWWEKVLIFDLPIED